MSQPDTILVSPTFAAMVKVYVKFEGRDRRRIKREINKALRQVRPQQKAKRAS